MRKENLKSLNEDQQKEIIKRRRIGVQYSIARCLYYIALLSNDKLKEKTITDMFHDNDRIAMKNHL